MLSHLSDVGLTIILQYTFLWNRQIVEPPPSLQFGKHKYFHSLSGPVLAAVQMEHNGLLMDAVIVSGDIYLRMAL